METFVVKRPGSDFLSAITAPTFAEAIGEAIFRVVSSTAAYPSTITINLSGLPRAEIISERGTWVITRAGEFAP